MWRAMAVNTLEELVNAALNAQGYLTIENAAYSRHPNAKSLTGQDAKTNPASDIDVLAFAPLKTKAPKVYAINCKGNRDGLMLPAAAEQISAEPNSPLAKGFRELCQPDWATAYRHRVHGLTGCNDFVHVTVVRSFTGDARGWTEHAPFKATLTPHLKLWTIDQVIQMLLKGGEKLHFNNNARKLVDLLYRAA